VNESLKRQVRALRVMLPALLAVVLLGFSVVFWIYQPAPVVTYPPTEPVLVSDEGVPLGGVVSFIRPGQTCVPVGERIVVERRAIGYLDERGTFDYEIPNVGFDLGGGCFEDQRTDVTIPNYVTPPGRYRIEFRACTNYGSLFRERCVTSYSPFFMLVAR
jgi:hypothetical protein